MVLSFGRSEVLYTFLSCLFHPLLLRNSGWSEPKDQHTRYLTDLATTLKGAGAPKLLRLSEQPARTWKGGEKKHLYINYFVVRRI